MPKVSDTKVKREIEKLLQSEKRAFRQKHGRFDLYEYLQDVHTLHCEWRDIGGTRTRKAQIAKLFNLNVRADKRLIHVIIDASSTRNSRIKNRWVQALRAAYTHRKSVKKTGLAEFIRENGGLQNCAGV
jgi:hypothetical protein